MGKHAKPGGTPVTGVTEATLARATEALTGLGYEALHRPDRVVVGMPAFTVSVWIDYERPLTLVVDVDQRVPVAFEHGRALAAFLNMWNSNQLGAVASSRLADSGDFTVHLRRGVLTGDGLSDEQLEHVLVDAMEHAHAFTSLLRERFLPVGFDAPLPPALLRALDHEALVGRHPSQRHLPEGEERDVFGAPDTFTGETGETAVPGPLTLADLEAALDALEFAYARLGDVLTTGANGVAFAFTLDGAGDSHARATAMWDSDLDAEADFVQASLLCNEVNERSPLLGAYVQEVDGQLQVHAETTVHVGAGLTEAQRDTFVVASLVSGLSAVDRISTQVKGESVVQWPSAG